LKTPEVSDADHTFGEGKSCLLLQFPGCADSPVEVSTIHVLSDFGTTSPTVLGRNGRSSLPTSKSTTVLIPRFQRISGFYTIYFSNRSPPTPKSGQRRGTLII
jgi:hypothetical protein